MAMKRFPCENYASLELNQVAFPKTGMVVSQTPLGEEFTKENPCENGMWVVADKAAGFIKAPAAATDKPIGIVYTAEKEYNDIRTWGLKMHARYAGEGLNKLHEYPRVGILGLGDTVTTNCLQYDTSVFATEEALEAALKAADTTPVYVAPVAGSAVPALVKAKPASGTYAKVVKYYTVPNGEKGVKYQIVSL